MKVENFVIAYPGFEGQGWWCFESLGPKGWPPPGGKSHPFVWWGWQWDDERIARFLPLHASVGLSEAKQCDGFHLPAPVILSQPGTSVVSADIGGIVAGKQCPLPWEDNIKEWTGLEWNIILRKAQNRDEWRKLVVKSTVVPQRSARLRDR